MGKLTAYLLTKFRAWERSTQIAFISAFLLLLLSLVVFSISAGDLRQSALIGFIGLIFALQIIFMWGNRTMVTAFTLAQRRYLAEDFVGARQILEQFHITGKPTVSSLTLLANIYRQLGLLDNSEEIVKKALALRPFDHFPLYSFGRTLIIKGLYAQAAETIQDALRAGAPPIVYFDLGEALYRAGNFEDSAAALEQIQNQNHEPFRSLMTDYLLYRMQLHDPPTAQLVIAGIGYWQELASRYQSTSYGQTLAGDIAAMQTIVEE